MAPLEVAPLDPGSFGVFDAEEVHGVVSGWIACGPIPSSPPAGAPPDEVPEPPPVGAPLEEVPVGVPPLDDPPLAVPPLWSEHPLPVWPPPESEPEHAVVAAERERTTSESESLSERLMWKTP